MWWFIAAVVIGLLVSKVPPPQTQKAPGLSDIEVPQAEDGLEIPVLFGTRDFKAPNVTFFGALRVVAIRKKGGK